jgi:predicted DNA-binding protein (MmcQ/YjbR family)
MNTDQVKALCRSLAGGVETLHAAPTNVLAYTVGGKNFAYFKTSAPEQWRFSFRVTPERFVELTDVTGVKPARYMGRYRWVTVVDVASFPADYLVELIQWSYENAVNKLTRAQRKALGLDHKQPAQ